MERTVAEVRRGTKKTSVFSPSPEWELSWKKYAELFRLPLLDETGEGIVSQTAEDLNLPLSQKVSDGRVKAPCVEPSRIKRGVGISLMREDERWVITLMPLVPLLMGVAGIALAVALSGGAFSLGLIRLELALYLVLPVALVVVFFGISIFRRLKHPEQLIVDKTGIWHRSWNRRRGWSQKDMALSDILNISLNRDPGSDAVTLVTCPKPLYV